MPPPLRFSLFVAFETFKTSNTLAGKGDLQDPDLYLGLKTKRSMLTGISAESRKYSFSDTESRSLYCGEAVVPTLQIASLYLFTRA